MSTMADVDFPSGSKWGGPQLESIGFESAARSFPLASFPWKDFLSNHELDPCIKIYEKLKVMFGPQSADTDLSDATRSFYEDLEILLEPPTAIASERIYRTRSQPALPESSPMTLFSSPPKSSITHLRDKETTTKADSESLASSQAVSQNTLSYNKEIQEQSDQLYSSSGEESGNSETERTPRPMDVKRRRLSKGYQTRDSFSRPNNANKSTQSEALAFNPDNDFESDQKPSMESAIMKLPFTPTRPSRLISTPTEDQLLSSRPSDFSYEPSSPLQPSVTPPGIGMIHRSDQAEVNTNTMVHLLLRSVFQELLNMENKNELKLQVSHDADNLTVPVRGHFVTTKPDLKITLRRDKEVITILDYEGKRLEPNMTIVQKFAQRVCHMIGRANQDMANETTTPRIVYLIVAQHTSISILSCKLKRKWLLMLQGNDLTPLTRVPKRFVNEYGPVDLADPDERILFVQMLCRLITHLVNVSKFGDDNGSKNDKKEIGSENNKDDKNDKDDKKQKEGRNLENQIKDGSK